MKYTDAKKLHNGDKIFCKYNGLHYTIVETQIDVEHREVYVLCDDGILRHHRTINDDFKEVNKMKVELTKKEIRMIKEALNYYGDEVADRQGYSSGEKYWDLMEKFNTIKE